MFSRGAERERRAMNTFISTDHYVIYYRHFRFYELINFAVSLFILDKHNDENVVFICELHIIEHII